MSIEKKVAKTILQEKQTIDIAGCKYEVSQPSLATLIKVSSIASTLPILSINDNKVLEQAIAVAPECGHQIAEIVATMILGVHKEQEMPFKALFSRFKRLLFGEGKTAYNNLVNTLMHEVTPRELGNLVVSLISTMHIEDFFGVTISLNEINLLRPTREMETTQHGQLQQEQQKDSD